MSEKTTPETQSGSRASSHDSRLLRAVGMWGLVASIVNLTIGGGIFRLPAGVYALLGTASPLAYLVCAVLMGLIVVCFAEAGSRVSLTGGLYAYVEVAFGPLAGFMSGVLLWAGMTAATSAVAVFFADALMAVHMTLLASPPPGGGIDTAGPSGVVRGAIIVIVLTTFAALNLRGIANAARFNIFITVLKLIPLALVIVAGLVTLQGDRVAVTRPHAFGDLARGSMFLLFAFLGVESALVPSGEVQNPSRTVPRAIAIAISLVVVVYVCAQFVAQSALGPALADSKTPLADAASQVLGSWGGTLILVGSAISMLGYVSGMTLSVPRMLYALGRDGFLMNGLAAVHPRFRTPHVAIIVQTVINIALATTGTFEQLAVVANGAMLLVYAACAVAVIQLRRKNVRTTEAPFVAPLGGLVPVLAFIAIAWLLTSLTRKEWLALTIVVAAALAIFAATQRGRSRAAA